jgi:hypothetical protein
MIDNSILEIYDAAPVEPTLRTGLLVYFKQDDRVYVVTTTFCQHAVVDLAVYVTGREVLGGLSVIYACPTCGTHHTIASHCLSPSESYIDTPRARAIFGWSEQRHARDKRVQWGMSRGGQR